jgi:diguanylate cyclase (GGDEF)-like protein/PAS domain S-box-containing protein
LQDALNEREEILAISNRHLRLAATAFESTFEAIMVTNSDNVIESVNPAFTMMTGFSAHEVIGKNPSILASGQHDRRFYQAMHDRLAATGHWQGEVWNKRRNGEIFVEWLTINVVTNVAGTICNYVAVFSDITNRKAAEERMRFLAQHDALTGLPNRALLTDRLMRAIAHAERHGKKFAVIFLDLDDFKKVNDSLGHHAGDQMLQIVAQRLTGCVRAEDTVARLGGDEFIVLMEEIGSEENVPVVAGKIVACLAQPMTVEGREMQISTSVGISLYPDHGAQPHQLIKNADTAMYRAKAEGRNKFHFFDRRSED